MHHLHIQKNKQHLINRAKIVRALRDFFDQRGFISIDAPVATRYPGQEPYLNPIPVPLSNERKKETTCYLHTSPEFTLKKTLAAGLPEVYSITPCFRNYESFGGMHNPEFTMLEWYRTGVRMDAIIRDCVDLMTHIKSTVPEAYSLPDKIDVIHMRELFQIVLNISLDDVLTTPNMHKLCLKLGHHPTNDEPYEDLFYRVFLNQIEPYLQTRPATIITHFPAQLAALAELDPNDHRYAERFELYLRHIELANAFTELCDPAEQKERFLGEQIKRKQLQKPVYPIDPSFLSAIEQIPGAAGIALGVDRLVMAALGCQDIDDVLVLPMSIQAST